MSNLLDYHRMSNFVTGVVDRKFVAMGQSLTSATGYLSGLITSAQAYVAQGLAHAQAASDSALEADGSAAASQTVFNAFTSTYVGLSTTDPIRSSLGLPVNSGAIYIRSTDGRLRYTNSVDSYNNPVWADATISADAASILSAGQGVFLTLNQMSLQTVKGPITFEGTLLGKAITSWTTRQLVTAVDVNTLVTGVSTNLSAEVTRATAVEQTLDQNKVNKAGDTMSGQLSIVASGEAASLVVRNNTQTGKLWRVSSANDGRLRFIDDTSAVERMAIGATGIVSIPAGLTVSAPATLFDVVVNRTDANDSGMTIQSNSVTRWVTKRSVSAGRYYIGRYNTNGVYIDAPFYINEGDGSVVQNATTINGGLSVKGVLRNDTPGANLILNNTSGINDPGTSLQHLGTQRWFIGRGATPGIMYINRFSASGAYQDTPFQISESSGVVTVNNLSVSGPINATGTIAAPILATTANGTGRGIQIGDDVWIGDNNFANGFSVRGVGDFNAGYITFGNSGRGLGTASGSTELQWGGAKLWHAGNMGSGSGLNADLLDGYDASAFVRVVAASSSDTGGYRVYSDGYRECWGRITVGGNVQNGFFAFPNGVGFQSYSNVVISGSSLGTNAQDNFVAVYNTGTGGFWVNNADDTTVNAWYQAKGY